MVTLERDSANVDGSLRTLPIFIYSGAVRAVEVSHKCCRIGKNLHKCCSGV